MKMKTRLATLLVVLATSGPLLSATEVERLRALCAEQEMQIRQLELKISRLTDTPPPSRSTVSVPSEARSISKETTYTVKSGDSLERIARKQGVSAPSLAKLNGLKADSIIHPGQKLKVPAAVANNEATPSHAKQSQTHTVQSGETYYKISRKYGVSVNELIAANPSVDHRALRIALNDFAMMRLRADVPFELKTILKDKAERRTKALTRATDKTILASNLAEDRKMELLRPRRIYLERNDRDYNRTQGLDYLDR